MIPFLQASIEKKTCKINDSSNHDEISTCLRWIIPLDVLFQRREGMQADMMHHKNAAFPVGRLLTVGVKSLFSNKARLSSEPSNIEQSESRSSHTRNIEHYGSPLFGWQKVFLRKKKQSHHRGSGFRLRRRSSQSS